MLLTTAEAAHLAGVNPRSFARWARDHHLMPVTHRRRGRSTVTLWSRDALVAAA